MGGLPFGSACGPSSAFLAQALWPQVEEERSLPSVFFFTPLLSRIRRFLWDSLLVADLCRPELDSGEVSGPCGVHH